MNAHPLNISLSALHSRFIHSPFYISFNSFSFHQLTSCIEHGILECLTHEFSATTNLTEDEANPLNSVLIDCLSTKRRICGSYIWQCIYSTCDIAKVSMNNFIECYPDLQYVTTLHGGGGCDRGLSDISTFSLTNSTTSYQQAFPLKQFKPLIHWPTLETSYCLVLAALNLHPVFQQVIITISIPDNFTSFPSSQGFSSSSAHFFVFFFPSLPLFTLYYSVWYTRHQ